MAASHLGKDDDYTVFENDISELSMALQEYAWDEATGYYGYVTHDSFDKPSGILKFNDTINYNMGLGGVSPLVSGIATPAQTEKMVDHLKTLGEIWSPIGLSTVDQSAPYYNNKGYWNGSVWMPHQWFYWKAMLDLGEDDFAYKIATTALDLWKRETDKTYNCYEYFSIETGGAKGWHQFSGLSTPVMSWFNAYYKIGNITGGHDVWITSKKWNENYSELTANLKVNDHKDNPLSIIVCVNPANTYRAFWNNKEINSKELEKGVLSITINTAIKEGELKIVKN
jgi:hypothetical protein